MSDLAAIRDQYLEAWNEPDDAARLALLRRGWSADASYVDPMMSGDGHDGISAMIGAARATFPGHSFHPRGSVDGHGSFVRFSWSLVAGGEPVANGTDVVTTDPDGRIRGVVGFLDRP